MEKSQIGAARGRFIYGRMVRLRGYTAGKGSSADVKGAWTNRRMTQVTHLTTQRRPQENARTRRRHAKDGETMCAAVRNKFSLWVMGAFARIGKLILLRVHCLHQPRSR